MEYKDLDVWKKARNLAKETMIIANSLPSNQSFSLAYQLSKSAISIPSNIAEGCGRNTTKDTLQFLFVSRGSIYELETQVFLCFDFGYITETQLNDTIDSITECKKLLNGFINYYKGKL
jgi:four helix bundle protein